MGVWVMARPLKALEVITHNSVWTQYLTDNRRIDCRICVTRMTHLAPDSTEAKVFCTKLSFSDDFNCITIIYSPDNHNMDPCNQISQGE